MSCEASNRPNESLHLSVRWPANVGRCACLGIHSFIFQEGSRWCRPHNAQHTCCYKIMGYCVGLRIREVGELQ